jgi:hypothetical protein
MLSTRLVILPFLMAAAISVAQTAHGASFMEVDSSLGKVIWQYDTNG